MIPAKTDKEWLALLPDVFTVSAAQAAWGLRCKAGASERVTGLHLAGLIESAGKSRGNEKVWRKSSSEDR